VFAESLIYITLYPLLYYGVGARKTEKRAAFWDYTVGEVSNIAYIKIGVSRNLLDEAA
jgi:hypothetical protein